MPKSHIDFLNEMNEKHSFSIPLTTKYRIFSKLQFLEDFCVLRLYMEDTKNKDIVSIVPINSIEFFPISAFSDESKETTGRIEWVHEREKQQILNMSRYFSAIKELEEKESYLK